MGIFDWLKGKTVHNVTDKDNNTTVTAKVGDSVYVTLDWRPSAGYMWQQADCTAGILEGINHPPGDDKPGAIATVQFVFEVKGPGYLQLMYSRPWSETDPSTKWFRIDVVVA